ncbi:MAG: hypothetical protein KAS99_02070 [Candidatus Omnitrophica bacterium]|nr:hypothetical protein [Candidatus Omnitrophota bacterium]
MQEYINREKIKLKNFISNETQKLIQETECYVKEKPFLKPFQELVRKCSDCLDSSIEEVLEKADEYEDSFQISKTIKQIADIVQFIIYFLTECLLRQDKVDREIYHVFEWFFEQCGNKEDKKVRYIVSLGHNIAMTEFQQILKSISAEIIYAKLFEEFNDWKFYIIYITPYSCLHTNSLNWVIFFHECGHIVDDLHGKTHSFYQDLPKWWHVLEEQANQGRLRAIEKRWVSEYTADYISTHIIGPSFVWRFVREYLDLFRIFEPSSSHPPMDKRITFLLEELKNIGFEEESEKLKDLLEALPLEAPSEEVSVEDNRDQIIEYYKSCLPVFNREKFEVHLKKYPLLSEKFKEEIKQKRPLILPPSTLYTLILFDEDIESDGKMQVFFADCIRLFIISEKFKAVFAPNPSGR